MAHEILSVKLWELGERLSRLDSRIRLSETAGPGRLRQEIDSLARECAEAELSLEEGLRRSRAKAAAILAKAWGEAGQAFRRARAELEAREKGRDEAAAEEKILLAEYALDIAVLAADRALLLSMEAIAAQQAGQEQERNRL